VTTAEQSRASLEEVIKPALDAYGEALNEHWALTMTPGCGCGWTPRETMQDKSKRRAVALHVSAARKRAEAVYDAESARLMDEARKPGGVWAR
jgi:hypothetical protein